MLDLVEYTSISTGSCKNNTISSHPTPSAEPGYLLKFTSRCPGKASPYSGILTAGLVCMSITLACVDARREFKDAQKVVAPHMAQCITRTPTSHLKRGRTMRSEMQVLARGLELGSGCAFSDGGCTAVCARKPLPLSYLAIFLVPICVRMYLRAYSLLISGAEWPPIFC